jgi:hypothetical protein
MPIKNLSKKTILAKKYKICRNIFSKSLGLMFSKKDTLIFIFKKEKINPLHMFFVFYPIDVLFLNKNKIVVEIKENFKPFTFYTPRKKSKFIIESPKGTIKKSKTKINDKINF